MKVYLINKQDKYCPENNNGDYIVEIYLGKNKAERRAKTLDRLWPSNIHYVQVMEVKDFPQ